MSRAVAVACVVLLAALAECEKNGSGAPSPVKPVAPDAAARRRTAEGPRYAVKSLRKPAYFEENRGQSDRRVRYLLRSSNYALFLTPTELVTVAGAPAPPSRALAAPGPLRGRAAASLLAQRPGMSAAEPSAPPAVLRMAFVGARSSVALRGEAPLKAKLDHIIGKDPSEWIRDVPLFREVVYDDLYPGIDLKMTLRDDQPVYEFQVAPEADLRAIRLRFTGAKKLSLDDDGNLRIALSNGEIVHTAPRFFEVEGGTRRELAGRFERRGKDEAGFSVAHRSPGARLIIDPYVGFGAYLGLTVLWEPRVSAVRHNDVWLGTTALGTLFPAAPPVPLPAVTSACVARLDLDQPANPLLFERCFGSQFAYLFGLAARPDGGVYVLGRTSDPNFPAMNGRFDAPLPPPPSPNYPASYAGWSFLLLLDGNGQIDRSTWVVGDGVDAFHLAVEEAGPSPGVYITGRSPGGIDSSLITFPPSPPPLSYGSPFAAIVAKFNLDLTALDYLSVLAGSFWDEAVRIAVRDGYAYVAGGTTSWDLQTSPGAMDQTLGPGSAVPSACTNGDVSCADVFIARLDREGKISYATPGPDSFLTFFGAGGIDLPRSVAIDGAGDLYVTGLAELLTLPHSFLLKLRPDGTPISTEHNFNYTWLVVVTDSKNWVHLFGAGGGSFTSWTPPPPAGGLHPAPLGQADVIYESHDPAGQLKYFTFLGGSSDEYPVDLAIDERDCLYATGCTNSNDFGELASSPSPLPVFPDWWCNNWLLQICPSARTLTLDKARMTPEEAAQLGWPCSDQAYAGAKICFKSTLYHDQGDPLTDGVLLDTLPPGFALDAVSTTAGTSCDTSVNPIRCIVSQLNESETATVWVRAVVGDGAVVGETLCNAAGVEAEASDVLPDDTVEACLEVLAPPRLGVSKGRMDPTAAAVLGWDCTPDPVEPGDPVCFTVLVSQDPTTAASGTADLTDTLPAELSLEEIRATPGLSCPSAGNPLACTVAPLGGGQFVTLHLRAAVDAGAQPGESLCNRVEVESTGGEVVPEDPVESCVALRTLEPATLRFQKLRMSDKTAQALGWPCESGEIEADDTVCFVITLTHGGGDPFPASVIEDWLPEGLTLAEIQANPGTTCDTSDSPIRCRTPALAAGDSSVVIGLRTVVGREASPGEELCNRARLEVDDETVLPENPTSACVTVKPPPGPLPVLHLSKRRIARAGGTVPPWRCDADPVDPGREVCFEVTLAHEPGTPPSGPGTLIDHLPPAGLDLVAFQASPGLTCAQQTDPLVCQVAPLAGLDQATLRVLARLDPQTELGTRPCNVAEAEVPGADVRIAEPAVGVPGVEACLQVTSPAPECLKVTQRLLTPVQGTELQLTCDTPSFTPGEHLCFRVIVTLGEGCAPLDSPFHFVDSLHGVLEERFISGATCDFTSKPIRCTVNSLRAGQKVTLVTRSLVLDQPPGTEGPPRVPLPTLLCNTVGIDDYAGAIAYDPAPSICVQGRLAD